MLNAYYAIIPLLIIGISMGYTTFPVAIVALLPLLFMTTKHTVGIFLLMYGGPLGRAMFPGLPIYGLILEFIGVILLWDIFYDMIQHHYKAILGMLLTLIMFGVFYMIGPKDAFAIKKYTDICIHGSLMLFGYFAFERSSKIDIEGLTRILLVAAICMYAYVIKEASMSIGDIFDYNWFRDQYMIYYHLNDNVGTLVSYQHIGMLILFATAIYCSQTKLQRTPLLFYLICASQMVLTSGCRQAMLGVALVIALRFVVFRMSNVNSKNAMGRMVWIIVGLLAAYYALLFFFENLGSDVITRTLSEGDSARQAFFVEAVAIFMQEPLMGAGLGGFHAITGSVYPHNMFFELLCETGLIGIIASLLLLTVPLISKKQGLLHITKSNQFFFLIVLAIFVRVMVSSDLTESIELFSAVFAITATKTITLKSQNHYPVKAKTYFLNRL